jgi:hypothetical protein
VVSREEAVCIVCLRSCGPDRGREKRVKSIKSSYVVRKLFNFCFTPSSSSEVFKFHESNAFLETKFLNCQDVRSHQKISVQQLLNPFQLQFDEQRESVQKRDKFLYCRCSFVLSEFACSSLNYNFMILTKILNSWLQDFDAIVFLEIFIL